MKQQLPDKILTKFESALGPEGLVSDPAALEPYLAEWRGRFRGRTPLLLRPADTAQTAAVLQICAAHRIGVVPQGGNTGLVGGAVPDSSDELPQVLLSTSRMNRIRAVDAENYTLTAEAGCRLVDVQQAAAEADRLFPLSLAAEGSCQLGGNISTNAGGINVLRYGNTRDLVLGLEVVLPGGRIFEGLRGLRKDNTGYDLKQLFIGAEGTLGVITAAVVKLFPRHRSVTTALVAVPTAAAALALYERARDALEDRLVAFELMNRLSVDLVVTQLPGTRAPLAGDWPWCVLLEAGGGDGTEAAMERFLEERVDAGEVLDGTLAQSGSQREALWHLRHSISEAQKLAGPGMKHDISVPVSRIPAFIERADALVSGVLPEARCVTFGHLGDGNLHYNLLIAAGENAAAELARRDEISAAVHALAVELGGSFSAEHGVGRLKTGELRKFRGGVEFDLMLAVKRAIDPDGLMNPGKLFGADRPAGGPTGRDPMVK